MSERARGKRSATGAKNGAETMDTTSVPPTRTVRRRDAPRHDTTPETEESGVGATEHPFERFRRRRGNRAVQALLEAPGGVPVGRSTSVYEREADRAAEAVGAGEAVPNVEHHHPGKAVQRQPLEEEEPELVRSATVDGPTRPGPERPSTDGPSVPVVEAPAVPTPVVPAPVPEAAEAVAVPTRPPGAQEADAVPKATPMVVSETPMVVPEEGPLVVPEEALITAGPEPEARLVSAEREEELVQPKAVTGSPQPGSTTVRPPEGGGRPLPTGARSFFESRFGRGFGDVHVHTGTQADAATRALGAEAFTHGRDIYFRSGRFRPETDRGRGLLAHELTHTVQQRPARTPQLRPSGTGAERAVHTTPVGGSLEREARLVANRIVDGGDVRGLSFSAVTAPVVARQVAGEAASAPASPAPSPTDATGAPGLGRPVELQGQATFDPSPEVDQQLADAPENEAPVPVAFGGLASGTVRVRREDAETGATYATPSTQSIPITHSALRPLREAGITPLLAVNVADSAVTGYVTVGDPSVERVPGAGAFAALLEENPGAMGWVGMDELQLPDVTNSLEGGTLTLSVSNFEFRLGGFLDGTGSFGLTNETVTFGAEAVVDVPKLSQATLRLSRDERGNLYGSVEVPVALASFEGNLLAEYGNGTVSIEGQVGYQSEKFDGTMTLLVTDEETARNVARDRLGADALVQSADEAAGGGGDTAPAPAPAAEPAQGPRPGPRALAGYGTLNVHLTEWLTGTAGVIVDSEGHITIDGEIAPPAEVVLFEQKDFIYPFPRLEARAIYGVPVVGNVFVFANVGLNAEARLGPAKLYDIVIMGRYSTDPDVFQNFSLAASLNVSAFAGLRLRAEGGAGVELVDHDIKVGVGVNGLAGIRGYVDARPTVGYREQTAPEEGKQGEFYIQGHMEIAAQPFIGLSGDLFVELDSPFWSPAPDEKWTWPLGELEYPLPGQFGIGADLDYVIGSGEVPNIEFGEVDFDSQKFMTDMMADEVGRKSKGEQERQGTFEDTSGGPSPTPEVGGQSRGGQGEVAEAPALRSGGGRGADEPVQGQQRGKTGEVPSEEVANRFLQGMKAIEKLGQETRKEPLTPAALNAALADIKHRYGFSKLEPVPQGEKWAAIAVMNPTEKIGSIFAVEESETAGREDRPGVLPVFNAVLEEIQQMPGFWPKVRDEGLTEGGMEEMLKQAQNRLKKKGIEFTTVKLGPKMPDGGRPIIVASRDAARQEISRVIPREFGEERSRVESRQTVADASLVFAEPVPEPSRPLISTRGPVRDESGNIVRDEAGDFVLEERGLRSLPEASEATGSGGYEVPRSASEPERLRLVVFNAKRKGKKDYNDKDNLTHAEHQLVQWLSGQDLLWRRKVREIELNLNWSPCQACTRELAGIVQELPNVERAVVSFPEIYPGETLGTRIEDLKTLSEGWTVRGPPIPERAGDKKGRLWRLKI